jgi:hypothetical protein
MAPPHMAAHRRRWRLPTAEHDGDVLAVTQATLSDDC